MLSVIHQLATSCSGVDLYRASLLRPMPPGRTSAVDLFFGLSYQAQRGLCERQQYVLGLPSDYSRFPRRGYWS